MKFVKIIVFLFFGFVVIAACSPKKADQKYLAKIDSLQISLEEVAVLYESLDTNLLREQYNIVIAHLKTLEEIGNINDSIPVTPYNYVRKSYKMFFKEHPYLTGELAYTRSQIRHLRNDVEKGLLSKENRELYFEQERQAVRVLKQKMSFYYQRISSYQKEFEESNPQIEAFIDKSTQK